MERVKDYLRKNITEAMTELNNVGKDDFTKVKIAVILTTIRNMVDKIEEPTLKD